MSGGEALIRFGFALIAVAAVVGLFALFVTSAEQNSRERDCFQAGGRITAGVCIPVDGAIKLEAGA